MRFIRTMGGVFHIACEIRSHADRTKVAHIPKMLVDTGSEYTWVSETLLKKLRIPPEKKDLTFVMANGLCGRIMRR